MTSTDGSNGRPGGPPLPKELPPDDGIAPPVDVRGGEEVCVQITDREAVSIRVNGAVTTVEPDRCWVVFRIPNVTGTGPLRAVVEYHNIHGNQKTPAYRARLVLSPP